jgi:SPP1 family predicted phage head-tail adaptor
MLTGLAPNFYPSRLTIQVVTETRTANSGLTESWADVAGSVDLACRIAPVRGTETRTAQQILTETTHVCVVPRFLPSVTTKHHAIVDGATYDITAVEYDGQQLPGSVRRSTRLALKRVI